MNCANITTTFLVGEDVDYILFKLAIDFASEGLKIWFICIRPFDKVPTGIEQPCKDVLKLITFIYINNYIDLMKHLNGIHKWKHIPNMLLLKNFEEYSNFFHSEYDSQRTAFLVTLLLDSVSFLSRKQNSRALLLVSCDREEDKEEILKKRLKVLCDMYFDQIVFKDELESDKLVKKIKEGYLQSESTTQ